MAWRLAGTSFEGITNPTLLAIVAGLTSNGNVIVNGTVSSTGVLGSSTGVTSNGNVGFGIPNTILQNGTGSPAGVVSGNPGDLYCNKSGGVGTTFYIKQTGTGTTAGWLALG